MTTRVWLVVVATLLALLLFPSGCSQTPSARLASPAGGIVPAPFAARESARAIPVTHDVDVVVVGGSSAGVAAAVAAAEAGASVFLAAPRPYLGEDLCATYRLWLEPDEKPQSALAKAIFAEPKSVTPLQNALAFTYAANVESSAPHKDATPPKALTDGKWHSAPAQSVQYNGDVTLTADLGQVERLRRIHVMAYQRNADFDVERVTVHTSRDEKHWQRVAVIANSKLGQGSFEQSAIQLSAWLNGAARYVRFTITKSAQAKRVLLGELVIEGPAEVTPTPLDRTPPTPMQVKRVLDEALLEAGVQFLYGCYATDVLQNEKGQPAGIVMANQSGRQAVKAKVIIDATARANVARMAGAYFDPYPRESQTFKRIVVGGPARQGQNLQARTLSAPIQTPAGRTYEAIEYTLTIPMDDASYASFARAEHIARDMTWHAEQVDASEVLFQVPPDRIKGKALECCVWPGADRITLDVFRPAQTERLFVLGGCADVARSAAEKLLRPLEYIRVGQRIGVAASVEARTAVVGKEILLKGVPPRTNPAGAIREDTGWMRVASKRADAIESQERAVPILGEYDVVVVGGGTAGAPAGIAAARQGAKTLVVEYLHGLGGIGTMGLISKYYYGYRVGFTKEIDRGLAELGGPSEGGSTDGQAWNSQLKIEWYRQALRSAGADIWYGTLGCGALVDDGRITGVVVATPAGRGVVLAKTVIDSTGSATIAAAAGADCTYTSGEHIAVQGTGLPYWGLGARYTNTDYTFVDDIDVVDTWRSFLIGRKKFKDRYDLGQLVDARERRQIVGDFHLSPIDAYLGRTFPDTIVRASSNFDTHGFTIHPMFMLKPPDRDVVPCYVPYRSLLPKGLEAILVTGLAVSAHRDVMPVIRMQPDVQNQGYAVGIAAATAARSKKGLREIDIRALQQHLVEKGNLPKEILSHADSFPLSDTRIKEAVGTLTQGFNGIEIVFSQPDASVPLLREAYEQADSSEDKLTYAHVLGIMGVPDGVAPLVEAVKSHAAWDKGWKYTGMGQYGRSLSPLDSLIIALGRTRRAEALAPILEKVQQLGPEHAMSHHRAVAMALEAMRDPGATGALAELLSKPGMRGHAYVDIDEVAGNIPSSPVDTTTREQSLRELILARALYRCGDKNGLAKTILSEYARDLRGHYARHAMAILEEEPAAR